MNEKKYRWMDGFSLSPKKNPGDLPYVPSRDGERRKSDRRKPKMLDSVERMSQSQ